MQLGMQRQIGEEIRDSEEKGESLCRVRGRTLDARRRGNGSAAGRLVAARRGNYGRPRSATHRGRGDDRVRTDGLGERGGWSVGESERRTIGPRFTLPPSTP